MRSKAVLNDPLPESASLLLDVIRFSAALMVVAGHYNDAAFHLSLRNHQIFGDIAVPVFFVLSGFVIRFVTRTREGTARIYFIDRASRIYSVVLPSLAFTLCVAGVCRLVNREQFQIYWAATCDHVFLRLLANLTFVSQAWGRNSIPFVNSPFWSLGYECVYYLLYGLFYYLRGWKRVLSFALVALLIGPQVLFLLPIWWLGCWLYEVYLITRRTRLAQIILSAAALWILTGAAFAFGGGTWLIAAPAHLVERFSGLPNPLLLIGFRPMRATMFAIGVGVVSAFILFVLLLLVDGLQVSRQNAWAPHLRYMANGTFTIYLMHYPFMLLLSYVGVLRPGQDRINLIVVIVMCAVLTAAAGPIDQFKNVLRRWLMSFPSDLGRTRLSSDPL